MRLNHTSPEGLWFVRREVETERQAASVDLLVGAFSCVVLVLVVWIELKVLAQGQQGAGIQPRGSPLGVEALVQGLCAGVRAGMKRVNRDTALDCNSIAIPPFVGAVGPIEIGSIPVRNQQPAGSRNMEREDRLEAIGGRSGAGGQVAIPERKRHGHDLRVVEIEGRDVIEFFHRFVGELKAGADGGAIKVAVLDGAFALKFEPNIGSDAEVSVNFREEVGSRSLRSRIIPQLPLPSDGWFRLTLTSPRLWHNRTQQTES